MAFHPGAVFALVLAPIHQIREHRIRKLNRCSFSVQDTFELLLQSCFGWGTAQDCYMPDVLQHQTIGRQVTHSAKDGLLGLEVGTR